MKKSKPVRLKRVVCALLHRKALLAPVFLFFTLAVSAQSVYEKAPFLFSTKTDGTKTSVVFKPSEYKVVQWVTVNKQNRYSEIKQSRIYNHLTVEVKEMAMFWLIGEDTVAVTVASPAITGKRPVIVINGTDIKTGKLILDKKKWDYNTVVPMLTEEVEEEDQD